jgi:hypothetical protein
MISPPMPHKLVCEELNRIKLEAIAALHSARKTRRSRDLSFHEDVELTRDEHEKIDALLKHLLAGHEGLPCPAGERPIIGISRAISREVGPGQHSQSSARALAVRQRRH